MNNITKDILTKRFQTTMIGALYEFENNFGHLWGIDEDDNKVTEKQEKLREIWEYTRNSILNNGNNQLRKCISDLEKTTDSVKYNYKFYPKNKRGN